MLSLIKFKSIAHIGRTNVYYVDIIRDVISLVPIHSISEKVVRDLCISVYVACTDTYCRLASHLKQLAILTEPGVNTKSARNLQI